MLRLEMPADKPLWKATTHQRKMHHLSSELRTSQLRSATHEYCQASRRTATGPASSCRSIGYFCPLGSRSVARNTRPASGCRPYALAEVAPQWEIRLADKIGPRGTFHWPRR